MANKAITVVVIMLVLVMAAAGIYVYQITEEIDILSGELAALQGEQEGQLSGIESISDALLVYDEKSIASLTALDTQLQTSLDRITASEETTRQTEVDIAGIEQSIVGLDARIKQVAADVPLQADEVYQAVSRAVVEITDGTVTIGTGFIYDSDGHIVTANHVVEDLDEIFVVFPDGRFSLATVVGTSVLSDVAVLQLEKEIDITPLALADSSLVEIGSPVVAVGSPFDLTGSITSGIVSQVNRFVEIGGATDSLWISNLIQFDAAANYGNSGGPLLNAEGQVLGIIIARIGPENGEGISYAVSANKVRLVADAIIDDGGFNYPSIGITGDDITPGIATMMNRESVHGVIVSSVIPVGPAAIAGFRVNDIITSINGIEISDMAGLTSYLGESTNSGEVVAIRLERNGNTLELTVKLRAR